MAEQPSSCRCPRHVSSKVHAKPRAKGTTRKREYDSTGRTSEFSRAENFGLARALARSRLREPAPTFSTLPPERDCFVASCRLALSHKSLGTERVFVLFGDSYLRVERIRREQRLSRTTPRPTKNQIDNNTHSRQRRRKKSYLPYDDLPNGIRPGSMSFPISSIESLWSRRIGQSELLRKFVLRICGGFYEKGRGQKQAAIAATVATTATSSRHYYYYQTRSQYMCQAFRLIRLASGNIAFRLAVPPEIADDKY
uniref:uncharacterized protein LOC127065260 n=1 Tax=Vespula vulgaris TaxID=7454 RepID=UPI00223C0711|nr:uncharacterized protein LOC127065260 [Vespula vulgaris]